MLIVHDHENGRSIADTAGMQAVTARLPATIRVVCRGLREAEGYDIDACSALLDEHEGEAVTLTAVQAEAYLAVPVGTIWSWVSRGKLVPVGRDGRSPLYAAADLVRLRNET